MKRGLVTGIITILLIVVLIIIFYPRGEDIPSEASCKINSDCVKFENPCCGCDNGGTAYSVNNQYLEEVKSKINAGCSQISDYCTPEAFHDRCDYSVKCWDGMCGFENVNPRGMIISGNWSYSN